MYWSFSVVGREGREGVICGCGEGVEFGSLGVSWYVVVIGLWVVICCVFDEVKVLVGIWVVMWVRNLVIGGEIVVWFVYVEEVDGVWELFCGDCGVRLGWLILCWCWFWSGVLVVFCCVGIDECVMVYEMGFIYVYWGWLFLCLRSCY